MTQHFFDFMDLAISTCFDYGLTIERSLELIGAAVFELISLGGKTSHSRYHNESGRQHLLELLRKHALRVDSVHAPFGGTTDLSEPEEVLRHASVIDVRRAIEACAELGGTVVIIHLNSLRTDNISKRMKSINTSLSELLETARSCGVRLALENLPGDGSLVLLKYALQVFNDELIGLCFDNGHQFLQPDAMELLSLFGDRLYAIHLHDNDGVNDLHLLPFEGKYDLPNLAAQFNKLEVRCPITIESESSHSRDSQAQPFLAAARKSGIEFIKMLKN
jgi:sugar phosphate isomerase/epimerase